VKIRENELILPLVSLLCLCLALESVKNLQVISVLPTSKEIRVKYDKPTGCFDQFILICENNLSKQQRRFPNSTICSGLIPNEFYRIYVETNRTGRESVFSDPIGIQLAFLPSRDQGKTKSISFD
jgi:hypothetical protein